MKNIPKAHVVTGIPHAFRIRKSILWMSIMLLAGTACSSSSPPSLSRQQALEKISFDISEIDENGLIGSPDSERSVAYEFCIPVDRRKRKEVAAIDSSVRFFIGPSGRVGCHSNQYLCIGNGGTQEVLLALAGLQYVEKILPFYGE